MGDAKNLEFPEGEELAKRKLDAESAEELPVEAKKAKNETVPNLEHSPEEFNGNSADSKADKGKGVAIAVDKGKGKMVIVEEEEDDDDSDDDDGSDEAVLGEDYESDFSDDPLAEVDLSNILSSRTRRRAPPLPGAYLVNEEDEDDEDDDDDDDDDDDEVSD